ncbi:hypothetical protein DFP72DRAFT_1047348 [Ephemerocybe angulata]|uniref:Uncharacterized protein n=1 Tax=Ephemerocybe angulata TaxID=980116 RepID=A0A8H6M5M9_9AGAR|nr:hypothetical protein DFP72DRAFT_1047348 [Tulosesus angulatus]
MILQADSVSSFGPDSKAALATADTNADLRPPPTFQSEADSSIYTYDNDHSHHTANAYIASANPSVRSQSNIHVDTVYDSQPPVYYDPETENVQAASERLARALEAEAAQESNQRAKEKLLSKARRIRKKAGKTVEEKEDSEARRDKSIAKTVGVGLLMFVTVPMWTLGAVMDATGTVLKASAMALKGAGSGFKKIHTVTMDKLDTKV